MQVAMIFVLVRHKYRSQLSQLAIFTKISNIMNAIKRDRRRVYIDPKTLRGPLPQFILPFPRKKLPLQL